MEFIKELHLIDKELKIFQLFIKISHHDKLQEEIVMHHFSIYVIEYGIWANNYV